MAHVPLVHHPWPIWGRTKKRYQLLVNVLGLEQGVSVGVPTMASGNHDEVEPAGAATCCVLAAIFLAVLLPHLVALGFEPWSYATRSASLSRMGDPLSLDHDLSKTSAKDSFAVSNKSPVLSSERLFSICSKEVLASKIIVLVVQNGILARETETKSKEGGSAKPQNSADSSLTIFDICTKTNATQ
ncbi:hypothetical protein TNCV_3038571 [Trichonephila clavipes]|nr:hypothetical protein TNCV_3038571 [Trichonephila clavipes]